VEEGGKEGGLEGEENRFAFAEGVGIWEAALRVRSGDLDAFKVCGIVYE